jgi:aspartyl-tRNA(Asn)/glutamyl-tRNA(Gln) amidotransferase subunit C
VSKTITKNDLKHMSWISRLELSDEEIEKFRQQIDDTIKYIDVLETFESENLNVDLQELDFSNLREDEIFDFSGDLIPQSALTQERLVKGPKMV